MVKKSLGYVELEWTCPNCSTRNPGPQKTCSSCGMPQPDDVQFEQPAQEKILTDKAKIKKAKAGPDIHCYYCGSRHPGDATTCTQCGADLTAGTKREHGQVLGAHRSKAAAPVNCPACGTSNQADAAKCVQCGSALTQAQPAPPPVPSAEKKPAKKSKGRLFGGLGLAAVGLICCAAAIAFFVLFNRTSDLTGKVDGVSWERAVTIEGLVPVTHEDWHDQLPAESKRGACTAKLRRTVDNPPSGGDAKEVCGTPYTVDQGSGHGEVVQDCKYEIYEQFCKYAVDEWREVDKRVEKGTSFTPRWPVFSLADRQREGEREETYTCHFSTEDGKYSYSSSNADLLNSCNVGSRWVLKVNTFNMVTDIEPAR